MPGNPPRPRFQTSKIDFHRGRFQTTRWSLVARVGSEDSAESKQALSDLCAAYWYPLYAFLRLEGHDHDRASESVQGFMLVLIERESIGQLASDGGRFRSYLLSALRHAEIDEFRKAATLKRGGQVHVASFEGLIDLEAGEKRFEAEADNTRTAEATFERRFAQTILERAFTQLAQEEAKSGRSEAFLVLKPLIPPGNSQSAAVAAQELGVSSGSVRVSLHRLRAKFRRVLRAEVGEIVSDPSEVDDEIAWLFRILAT